MIRLKRPVCGKIYRPVSLSGLSEYMKGRQENQPTHFTMEPITEGPQKGFEKVSYYREII